MVVALAPAPAGPGPASFYPGQCHGWRAINATDLSVMPIAKQFPADAVLLDLDGTLVNSVPDLTAALLGALEDIEVPAPAELPVALWVGNGLQALLARALGYLGHEADKARLDTLRKAFEVHYAARRTDATSLYPGVARTLAQMTGQGRLLACVTNKPDRFVRPLLAAVGIEPYFAVVIGGDGPRKPAPDQLLRALALLKISPQRASMVGDSSSDLAAARAAGLPGILVSYGYNHGQSAASLAPDALLDRFADLPALLAPVGSAGQSSGPNSPHPRPAATAGMP